MTWIWLTANVWRSPSSSWTGASSSSLKWPTAPHCVHTKWWCVGHFSDELLAPVHEELGERQAFAVSQIQVTAFGLCRDCQAAADVAAAAPARDQPSS